LQLTGSGRSDSVTASGLDRSMTKFKKTMLLQLVTTLGVNNSGWLDKVRWTARKTPEPGLSVFWSRGQGDGGRRDYQQGLQGVRRMWGFLRIDARLGLGWRQHGLYHYDCFVHHVEIILMSMLAASLLGTFRCLRFAFSNSSFYNSR
jgi:hypothetical protein